MLRGCDFRIRDETGNDRRVSEQDTRSGRSDAVPLAEDVETVGKVTHRVGAEDGVEARLDEGHAAAGV